MRELVLAENSETRCPGCGSNAFYRYGRSRTGKRRFLCLMCGMQFTRTAVKPAPCDRPACPACGMKMNVYMKKDGFTRFRCSGYPVCKTFKKVQN